MNDELMALIGAPGEWAGLVAWSREYGESVLAFDDANEAAEALARAARPAIACASTEALDRMGPRGVAALKQACHPAPVVVASRRVDPRAVQWLSWGVDAFAPLDPGGGVEEANASHALLVSMARRSLELARTRRELARRDAELSGLDALSHATAGALDATAIIHRSLMILSGMLFRPAAAFLTLRHGLDRSEVEPGVTPQSPRRSLRVAEQVSHDRLLVCAQPCPHASWDELLDANVPLVFRDPPADGLYPGLEPLWHRIHGGAAALIPVWGRASPIGVLVLAELQPREVRGAPLSREALRACASLIGGTLENARLFQGSRDAYDSLERAQDRLVRAEKFSAVGQISAQIAHEVNNPASFVISNLSVMRDYVSDIAAFRHSLHSALVDTHPAALEIVRGLELTHDVAFIQADLDELLTRSLAGMQRIHRIVQDMRHFAYDAGHEPNSFALTPFLESAIHVVRQELGAGVVVEVGSHIADDARIYTDPNRLSQVLTNLIINASHAIETANPSGVGSITLTATQDAERMVIVVRDTGPGIPEDQLHRVFEPFYTTKKRGQGTGLGLALSRDIVRRLGGELIASNEPGSGARFEVALPLRPRLS